MMKRRFALSLLTVLALLWQGLAAAAMVPAFSSSANALGSSSAMSEHCRMAMIAETLDPTVHAVALPSKKSPSAHDCCGDAMSHCVCAAACGSGIAAMPSQPAAITFTRSTTQHIDALPIRVAAAPPPHPFRPPISTSSI